MPARTAWRLTARDTPNRLTRHHRAYFGLAEGAALTLPMLWLALVEPRLESTRSPDLVA